jgi:1-acyl-sn-glycerol-3-phosphate acyltransferase
MEPAYGLARAIAVPLLRPMFRIRMRGHESIPRTGPVLLAGNHISVLDPLFMLWIGEKTRRHVRFLAMAELWDIRFLRFFMIRTHQIPVPRESAAAFGSLVHAAEALDAGRMVAVYPEGGVSRDFEPQPGKIGVARLAAQTGVPVRPVGVWGSHRLWPKGRKRRLRPGMGITVAIGDPISIPSDTDAFDGTDRIMTGIAAAVGEARRMYKWRPKRGDDGWWVREPETAVMRPARRGRQADRWS